MSDSLDAIRKASGNAWDDVEDPEAALREIRGVDPQSTDAAAVIRNIEQRLDVLHANIERLLAHHEAHLALKDARINALEADLSTNIAKVANLRTALKLFGRELVQCQGTGEWTLLDQGKFVRDDPLDLLLDELAEVRKASSEGK